MKITIEIPDNCYRAYLDEDDNLIVNLPPFDDRAKKEMLLDRSFDKWECFRSEIAGLAVDALLEMTPGYTHPEISKAQEMHSIIYKNHLNKCLDL